MPIELSGSDSNVHDLSLPQWRPFLEALAQELSTRLDTDSVRTLMRRLGVSMARSCPLPAFELLPELEAAMNAVWSRLCWGRVELSDAGLTLRIVHHGAPLEAAFGPGGLGWSPALFEGIYEHWLHAAGAAESLRVRQLPDARDAVHVFALAA